MNKYILLLVTLATVSGIIGFTTDSALTSFLRVFTLITADIAIILLIGKFVFFTDKSKTLRQRISIR
ncbi:hypothetical protein [Nonlabens antarcticus]|uniref:hypothetical protein n=1 Tax=Nonlabens antarcticus TaxID=392714 RepID=UPI001890E496|nr:hypothetical protein [Nonlabens antarcticus]